MRIRPVGPGDADFLFELVPAFSEFGLPPWRDAAELSAMIERSLHAALEADAAIFVAEDEEGERLGFVHLHPVRDLIGGMRAHVSDLAVTEAARGRGVGRLLLEKAEDWARERGYDLLGLTTIATNEPALAFYDRLGFGRDTITLVKPLR